ncbi:MAG: thiamine-phosphate kinase [Candidatus Hydrogenedens sp.]|nr:thiamine-phosphate kinase [Candidatus Hydrogenedens sp.]
MTTLSELGEFGFIARVTADLPTGGEVLAGIGDDCAVVRNGGTVLLFSCDASIEDVHFARTHCAPYDVGWKAMASAFSDIAAMGGVARYALASLACPPDTPIELLDELSKGAYECVAACGAVLLGGDTTRSPGPIMLDVNVIGEAPDGRYLLRSGAKPGDILAHTGSLGRSAAGLAALQRGDAPSDFTRAHLHPVPRLREGQWLAAGDAVHAMMDISDGLAQDAGHLAEASGASVDIDSNAVDTAGIEELAVALGAEPLDWALAGGEDYELLVAVEAGAFAQVQRDFEREFGLPLTAVGRFAAGQPAVTVDGATRGGAGFDHFR